MAHARATIADTARANKTLEATIAELKRQVADKLPLSSRQTAGKLEESVATMVADMVAEAVKRELAKIQSQMHLPYKAELATEKTARADAETAVEAEMMARKDAEATAEAEAAVRKDAQARAQMEATARQAADRRATAADERLQKVERHVFAMEEKLTEAQERIRKAETAAPVLMPAKVQADNKGIVNEIMAKLTPIVGRPKRGPWEFEIVRGADNRIERVVARPRT